MSKADFFYSPKEVIELKEIIRTGEPINQIAERIHEEYNTTSGALRAKLYSLAKNTTKIRKWECVTKYKPRNKYKSRIKGNTPQSIEMSEGFSFDIINVKRATLNSNKSVTLYF